MTRKTIFIVLLLAATLFSISGAACLSPHGRVRLFEKYDFESGRYAVVGMMWSEQRHKMQEALRDFYTDDLRILAELKEKWVTDEPSPVFACGYHYTIYVLKDGVEVESFSINLDDGCNTVATNHGYYYFDPNKLGVFIGKLKKPIIKRKAFKSPSEGRTYIKSLSGRTDVLMVLTPDWLEYDGEFRFYADCNFGNFDSNLIQRCVDRVGRQIRKKYDGEKFMVDEGGSMSGPGKSKILIRMKCFKNLYDRFDLYRVEWEWRGYSPELTVVWKRPPQ